MPLCGLLTTTRYYGGMKKQPTNRAAYGTIALRTLCVTLGAAMAPGVAHATGVTAGTLIQNTASATYTSSTPMPPTSGARAPDGGYASVMRATNDAQPPPIPPAEHIRSLVEANRVQDARHYVGEQLAQGDADCGAVEGEFGGVVQEPEDLVADASGVIVLSFHGLVLFGFGFPGVSTRFAPTQNTPIESCRPVTCAFHSGYTAM